MPVDEDHSSQTLAQLLRRESGFDIAGKRGFPSRIKKIYILDKRESFVAHVVGIIELIFG
jgi:hypothetical protein